MTTISCPPSTDREVDGVRKEKERLTAAAKETAALPRCYTVVAGESVPAVVSRFLGRILQTALGHQTQDPSYDGRQGTFSRRFYSLDKSLDY